MQSFQSSDEHRVLFHRCDAVRNPSVRGMIVSRRVARGVHEIARRGEVDNSAIENS